MDQKKTQRIIGIVIVIALVIILFPLLFSKNEPKPASQIVQAPPLPDQASTVSLQTAEVKEGEMESNLYSPQDVPVESTKPVVPVVRQDETKMEQTSQVETKIEDKPILTEPTLPALTEEKTNVIPIQTPIEKRPNKVALSAQIKSHTHSAKKGITTLNQPAWAVQMGSFRDKDNARRMVNTLRSAGYKAFTRSVATQNGTQIRVYVGPEFRHLAAIKLSSELQHNMKLHGIVVLYRPLVL